MLKILSPLLTSLAGEEIKSITTRAKRSAGFGAVIIALVLIGFIFLCLAAYLVLAEIYGGPIAALILAGISLFLALIAVIVMRLQIAAEQKRYQQRMQANKSALMATAAVATAPSLLKRPILAIALPIVGIALLGLLSDKKKKR